MSKLPALTAKEIMQKLHRGGFALMHVKGSHHFLFNRKTNRSTTVSVHCGKEIGRGLLRAIIKQAGISVKDFLEL